MDRKATLEAPCRRACPAGVDVPRYVRLTGKGRFDEALAVVREKIPFPSVCGHICFRPCEAACRLKGLGGAIPIRGLKRFVSERDTGLWREKSRIATGTGKKVAVIGAGPAGLTAAYYLVKQGHSVTLFDSSPEPGGKMRSAVFEYGLPEEVLDAEIKEIIGTGIEIFTNREVQSLDEFQDKGCDAVLVATGAHRPLKTEGERSEDPEVNRSFGLTLGKGSRIKIERKTLATGRKGIFACGDAVSGPSGPSSAIRAIASGRKAAVQVDLYLGGNGIIDEALAPREQEVEANYPWVSIGERASIPSNISEDSGNEVAEHTPAFIEEIAVRQAKRCLMCDLPIKVDAAKCCGCLICEMRCSLIHKNAFVPSEAYIRIQRVGRQETEYELSFTSECDSCGICARYCPYGALTR